AKLSQWDQRRERRRISVHRFGDGWDWAAAPIYIHQRNGFQTTGNRNGCIGLDFNSAVECEPLDRRNHGWRTQFQGGGRRVAERTHGSGLRLKTLTMQVRGERG